MRGDFKALENKMADALEDGKQVAMKVEPVYEEDSKRPTSFVVTYSIDQEEFVEIFNNERGGK